MKSSLALCSLALNPAAPSPTASMVRIAGGRMEAFGGLFAVSVPCPVDVGACFNPGAFATFFRKDRASIAYTLKNGKLTAQDGKEKLTVSCLPPEEMVMLDVPDKPVKIALDLTHLKNVIEAVEPTHSQPQCHGVHFRNGMMEASNGGLLVSAVTDLELDDFHLPLDTAKALLRFKSPIVKFATDGHVVKFIFKDGSWITSLLIPDKLIDTAVFYAGEWDGLGLSENLAKDLLSITCDKVEFKNGDVIYTNEKSTGTISGVCNPAYHLMTSKERIDILLRVSSDIRVCDQRRRLMAVSENCRAVAATLTLKN